VAPASVAPESQDNPPTLKKTTCATSSWKKRAKWSATARKPWPRWPAIPADVSQLTILRRAFHTLKGSSRMVGLNEFGEAAWSLEQMLNSWLADQKAPPMNSGPCLPKP
jgi:chemosensory pili system protein ChpA (sensor histidine kinase/response regulator)